MLPGVRLVETAAEPFILAVQVDASLCNALGAYRSAAVAAPEAADVLRNYVAALEALMAVTPDVDWRTRTKALGHSSSSAAAAARSPSHYHDSLLGDYCVATWGLAALVTASSGGGGDADEDDASALAAAAQLQVSLDFLQFLTHGDALRIQRARRDANMVQDARFYSTVLAWLRLAPTALDGMEEVSQQLRRLQSKDPTVAAVLERMAARTARWRGRQFAALAAAMLKTDEPWTVERGRRYCDLTWAAAQEADTACRRDEARMARERRDQHMVWLFKTHNGLINVHQFGEPESVEHVVRRWDLRSVLAGGSPGPARTSDTRETRDVEDALAAREAARMRFKSKHLTVPVVATAPALPRFPPHTFLDALTTVAMLPADDQATMAATTLLQRDFGLTAADVEHVQHVAARLRATLAPPPAPSLGTLIKRRVVDWLQVENKSSPLS